MEPPFRQLPPVRVEREDAVQRDTLAAFEKVAGRARLRDAQGLKPQYRQPAEAVVEMGARQVRRREVGPRPEHLGRVAQRPVRQVATPKPGTMNKTGKGR